MAQLIFLGLLLATERRFPEIRAEQVADAPPVVRPPLRTLFVPGLVLLLLGYQVLSAMGSQVVDFLLFDRAAAQYSGDDLTRFLSTYTAVLNLADILFLALLAGPLLRRFGLRLGLTFNPAIVAGVLAVMAVVSVGPGSASFALLVLAAVLRIGDIAATDGTTRTSINAAYQIVPADERLAVQSVVEGIGVPVAIGATGVLLLVLSALDLGIGAVIVFGLGLGVVWTGGRGDPVPLVHARSCRRGAAEPAPARRPRGRGVGRGPRPPPVGGCPRHSSRPGSPRRCRPHPCWRPSFAVSPHIRARRFACGRWARWRNRVTTMLPPQAAFARA